METGKLLLFLLLFSLSAQKGIRSDPLRIDCGAPSAYQDTHGSNWDTDNNYVRAGQNRPVQSGNFNSQFTQLNNLRVFTELKKNCYKLPTSASTRYLIRAGFHYGNYDGLGSPPNFNLEIGWNEWAIVNTSSIEHFELLYTAWQDTVYICLTRTQDNQFPFISMLEIFPLDNIAYDGLSRDVSWLGTYHYNYGAGPNNWILGYPDDKYNRIWTPVIPSGLNPVTSDASGYLFSTDNSPPTSMVVQLAQAQNLSNTIDLQFPLAVTDNVNYVVIYLTELRYEDDGKRSIDVYVNDQFMDTVVPTDGHCTYLWANTQSADTLRIQLLANENATLPPLISGVEVFTALAAPIASGTSLDDVQGLEVLTTAFEQLTGWSGDPCVPSDTKWKWIDCNGSDPARVISIQLEAYGLDGPLPDFSQMQALEIIDLGNNSLDGPIPSFLGTLPNLAVLDLHKNNFSGKIPDTIKERTHLNFTTKGNPGLNDGESKLKLKLSWKIWIPITVAVTLSISIVIIRRSPQLLGLIIIDRRQTQYTRRSAN